MNQQLAERRMASYERLVRAHISLPDTCVSRTTDYFPWRELAEIVRSSQLKEREQIVHWIDSCSQIPSTEAHTATLSLLKAHRGGRTWQWLRANAFPKLRQARVVFTLCEKPHPAEPATNHLLYSHLPADTLTALVPAASDSVAQLSVSEAVEPLSPATVPASPAPEEPWQRRFRVGTNLPAWLLLQYNTQAELDLVPHLSAALSVYYCAANFLTYQIKYRNFSIKPELRYWPSRKNHGFFAAAHGGMAYFNFAFDGKYRWQSHSRRTPALGGGLNVGFRTELGTSRHWQIEATLGWGCYHVHYDKYINRYGGFLVNSQSTTWSGIDLASVALVYVF